MNPADASAYVAASAQLYCAALREAISYGVEIGDREAAASYLSDVACDLAFDAPNVARVLPAVGGILAQASRLAFDARDAARDASVPLSDCAPRIRAIEAMLAPLG